MARSCYLTVGKWPVSSILRVPIGAYGSGGPIPQQQRGGVLCNIKGIKIAYPQHRRRPEGPAEGRLPRPEPVVMLEHKGLYWSKIEGTEGRQDHRARATSCPLEGPAGAGGRQQAIANGEAAVIVTYGMGRVLGHGRGEAFPAR